MQKQNQTGIGFLGVIIIIATAGLVIWNGYMWMQKESNMDSQIDSQIEITDSNLEQEIESREIQKEISQPESKIVADCGEVKLGVTPEAELTKSVGCIEENFQKCNPAELVLTLGPETKHYEIIRPSGNLCIVDVKAFKSFIPALVGKEMTCEYDKANSFNENVFEQDTLDNCVGILANLIKTSGLHEDSNCALMIQPSSVKIYSRNFDFGLTATGFKGNENEVSWIIKDKNIATLSALDGKVVKIHSLRSGLTEVTVTDNAVGPDCKVSVSVENQF